MNEREREVKKGVKRDLMELLKQVYQSSTWDLARLRTIFSICLNKVKFTLPLGSNLWSLQIPCMRSCLKTEATFTDCEAWWWRWSRKTHEISEFTVWKRVFRFLVIQEQDKDSYVKGWARVAAVVRQTHRCKPWWNPGTSVLPLSKPCSNQSTLQAPVSSFMQWLILLFAPLISVSSGNGICFIEYLLCVGYYN